MDRLPVYDGLHTLLFNSSKTQELFKQHTLTVFINENLEKCKNLLSVPRIMRWAQNAQDLCAKTEVSHHFLET